MVGHSTGFPTEGGGGGGVLQNLMGKSLSQNMGGGDLGGLKMVMKGTVKEFIS